MDTGVRLLVRPKLIFCRVDRINRGFKAGFSFLPILRSIQLIFIYYIGKVLGLGLD